MKNLVHKFLDDYLGNEIYIKDDGPQPFYEIAFYKWTVKTKYSLYSGTNNKILSFIINSYGGVVVSDDMPLYSTVENYLGVMHYEAASYTREWLRAKHGIVDSSSLMKFVPTAVF